MKTPARRRPRWPQGTMLVGLVLIAWRGRACLGEVDKCVDLQSHGYEMVGLHCKKVRLMGDPPGYK